jgi:hypothetical protein
LAAFQLKTTSKEDMRSLVGMVNASREGEPLTESELTEVFEVRWPEFLKKLTAITAKSEGSTPAPTPRSMDEILNEILSLTRGLAARENSSVVKSSIEKPRSVKVWDFESPKPRFESAEAELVYSQFTTLVYQERPLVAGWLELTHTVRFDSELKHLFLIMPPTEDAVVANLNRPATQKFLGEVAASLFAGKVSVVLMKTP